MYSIWIIQSHTVYVKSTPFYKFSCWTQIFFSLIGIGILRGWTMDRWLHVDTLILIPTLKIYVFLYSGQTDRQTDRQTEKLIGGEITTSIWRTDVSRKDYNSFLLRFLLIPKLNVYSANSLITGWHNTWHSKTHKHTQLHNLSLFSLPPLNAAAVCWGIFSLGISVCMV